jgi:hypothetical protein
MRAVLACLAFLSSVAYAGGDYRFGKIATLSGSNGSYAITFVQSEPGPALLRGCAEFDVKVRYRRVPWFSWLPFVASNHPSLKETEAAAEFLREAFRNERPVFFGYMGHGLVSDDRLCSFLSNGLRVHSEDGRTFVLSYHDPT